MIPIKYVIGNAVHPSSPGMKFIIHCCNDCGGWGRGFVLAISSQWKGPERMFRKQIDLHLGDIQICNVESDISVINMCGQHNVWSENGIPPIRYDAIQQCLKKTGDLAIMYKASIHAPRFGAGLAGGKWSMIESLIISELCIHNISVTIYDLAK